MQEIASSMKALLLRIGIDKGTDGALAPIFEDGSFEYIPISEGDPETSELRTYDNTVGRSGKHLSYYLPSTIKKRKLHYDPEFDTFTYGDTPSKRTYLLRLNPGDLLVFYAGLKPFRNQNYVPGLYIIGYFTVDKVIDFQDLPNELNTKYCQMYANNAHVKRSLGINDTTLVIGDKSHSKLIDKGILISGVKYAKNGRPYYVVSREMEIMLGISGSIQRSRPPRFIRGQNNVDNLLRILKY
jgi:hypothetical protein